MEILGQKIREARKQRGLRQADLAALVPTRRQVIGELERGVYKGSADISFHACTFTEL